jgi:predicted nucleic acid-binding protein
MLLIDEPAAEPFGRDKVLLRREGRPIGDIDLLIAAIARHHGLTVVTNHLCGINLDKATPKSSLSTGAECKL